MPAPYCQFPALAIPASTTSCPALPGTVAPEWRVVSVLCARGRDAEVVLLDAVDGGDQAEDQAEEGEQECPQGDQLRRVLPLVSAVHKEVPPVRRRPPVDVYELSEPFREVREAL